VTPSVASRIDTDLLRQQHPIVDVIGQYGIELRRTGSAFAGRCPFHVDRGRPNLTAYPYVPAGTFVTDAERTVTRSSSCASSSS